MFIKYIPQNLLKTRRVSKLKTADSKTHEKILDRLGECYLEQPIRHPKYGTGKISKMTEGILCVVLKSLERNLSR